ncbi:MAG: ABC transporter permease [Deltaproteobacteria bacterium]|jgi:putative ABC transport system permease protein|nr:ABC transporter permease [Deltaproteobacteria bacterium]
MRRWKTLARLAAQSSWSRRGTLALIVVSIVLSTILLVGLERLRTQIREGFSQSVYGVDLLVGPRTSHAQLVLYAIFHLGGATNNLGWARAQEVAALPEVAWVIPLSMGDFHRGFPVVATDENFLAHYRYRRGRSLSLAQGREFADLFEVTLGAEVARKLGYQLGDRLVLSHGGGEAPRSHDDKPFLVVGILAPTGSPVDRSLYISLPSMEAIHVDWRGGAPIPGFSIRPEEVRKFNLTPKSVTALLVGLKNRRLVFQAQTKIQNSPGEALSAVLPGVALDQIFQLIGTGEKSLFLVSLLVTVTGLLGLAATILAGLGERRRELAILRSLGASPWDIVCLITLESLWLTALGLALGLLALAGALAWLGPYLLTNFGASLELSAPTTREWLILGGILLAGLLTGLGPAIRAYFYSVADGLSRSS